MYEARDIEYVGLVPGGIEIILVGDYPQPMSPARERRTLELDHGAMRKLCKRYAEMEVQTKVAQNQRG